MNRKVHVRFCERLRGKFPRADPRSHNWIRGAVKPKRPIFGRIAAMIYNQGRVLLSSAAVMGEVGRIAASFLARGKAI